MDLLLVKAFIINNKSQTCLYVTTEKQKSLSCYFYMAIKRKLLFTALSVFVVHSFPLLTYKLGKKQLIYKQTCLCLTAVG